ncbi:MAG: nucleotidyltransferase domain-containing protein [Methylococcales bacterium]|nr:nucleotidyltransferase domain-containing protein [Methylococcales bacterium]
MTLIKVYTPVDAIYLYGSRAKQTSHKNSDWDIAVLFSQYETELTKRVLRPQLLEAMLERELQRYLQITIVRTVFVTH